MICALGSARRPTRCFSRVLVAVITGGGSGIGRAIVLPLTGAGARVVVGDVDFAAAEAVAARAGGHAVAVALDIAGPHQFAAFLDAAERRHGPLPVIVNNAGVDWVGPFPRGTRRGHATGDRRQPTARRSDRSRRSSGCCRARADIWSTSPHAWALAGNATYSATKHGVVGLTELLRLEWRGVDRGAGG